MEQMNVSRDMYISTWASQMQENCCREEPTTKQRKGLVLIQTKSLCITLYIHIALYTYTYIATNIVINRKIRGGDLVL